MLDVHEQLSPGPGGGGQIGVVLDLDAEAAARVRAVAVRLALLGFGATSNATEIQPHITLATCTGIDADQFRPTLAQFAAHTPGLPCTFASLGIFPTDEGVIFLLPATRRALFDIQEQIVHRLSSFGAQVGAYWLPGNWVPHCTLAAGIPGDRIPEAIGVCLGGFRPISGQLTQISVANIDLRRWLYRFKLRSDGQVG